MNSQIIKKNKKPKMHSSLSPLRDMSSNYFLAEDQIETQKAENKILRQKLQSKSEALVNTLFNLT